MPLLDLPPELLARIVALLPPASLPSAAQTCTALARLARSPGEVYRLELWRAGMVDGEGEVRAVEGRLAIGERQGAGEGAEAGPSEVRVHGWTIPLVDPKGGRLRYQQNHDEDDELPPTPFASPGAYVHDMNRKALRAYCNTAPKSWSAAACASSHGVTDRSDWLAELEHAYAAAMVHDVVRRAVARDAQTFDVLGRPVEALDDEAVGAVCATWEARQREAVRRQRVRREAFARDAYGEGVGLPQHHPRDLPRDAADPRASAGPAEEPMSLPPPLTAKHKLDLLTKRRTAWEHLAPRPAVQHAVAGAILPEKTDAPGNRVPPDPAAPAEESANPTTDAFKFSLLGETSIYECQDGIFLYTDNYTTGTQKRSPRNIRLYPLPTADVAFAKHDVPTASRYAGLAGGIADLTLDPQQDLLVVAENDPPPGPSGRAMHRYHFLKLSTLEPHPLARRPSFDAPMYHTPVDITAQLLQILGDVIGVLCTAYDPEGEILEKLFIWNWKTGEPLAYRTMRNLPQASGFVLLSPTHFLLVETREDGTRAAPIIHVMRAVSSRTPTVPVENIWDYQEASSYILFDADREEFPFVPRPITLVSFDLPRFASNTQTATVGIRPDPPSPPMHTSTPFAAHRPFLEDYREGILVFEMRAVAVDAVTHGGVETFKGNMFAPRSFFLDAALDMEAVISPDLREQVRVPWETWGSSNTRIMPDQSAMSRQWVVNSSGWRFVTTARGTPRSVQNAFIIPPRLGPHRVQVLDFSPVALRRFRHAHPEEAAAIAEHRQGVTTESGATVRLRDQPNLLPKSRIWELPVETHLPYLEMTSGQEYACDGVMMDEQRILLTRAHINTAGNLEQEVTVLTF